MRILLAFWTLVIVYLSLYPFQFAANPGAPLGFSLPETGGDWVDILANLLFYAPFGFLGLAVWRRDHRGGVAVICLLGMLLSLGMELAQIYLPTRYSSLRDLACNTAGTFAGCLVYRILQASGLRNPVPRPTLSAWVLIICWLFWQLFPFIPVLRRSKLAEIYAQMSWPAFHGIEFIDTALAAVALYVLALRPGKMSRLRTLLLVSIILFPVLLAQSLIVGMTLSNLRLVAAVSGLLVAFSISLPDVRVSWIALALGGLLWIVAREVSAPVRIPLLPAGHLAPYVRALAGRALLCFATVAAFLRILRYKEREGSVTIHSSRSAC